jgi:hypothetical protein
MDTHGGLWIELVGGIIIARIRGVPTTALLAQCQERVVEMIARTGEALVLYDALEMIAPNATVAWSQRTLDETLPTRPRRAIVVRDTKVAYLARLAFADEFGENRVFYNDMAEAFEWLKTPE